MKAGAENPVHALSRHDSRNGQRICSAYFVYSSLDAEGAEVSPVLCIFAFDSKRKLLVTYEKRLVSDRSDLAGNTTHYAAVYVEFKLWVAVGCDQSGLGRGVSLWQLGLAKTIHVEKPGVYEVFATLNTIGVDKRTTELLVTGGSIRGNRQEDLQKLTVRLEKESIRLAAEQLKLQQLQH